MFIFLNRKNIKFQGGGGGDYFLFFFILMAKHCNAS